MLYTSLILSLFVASARAGHDSWSCTGPWPEMGDGSIGEFCVVGMGTSPLVLNFPSATATDGIVGVTVLGAAGPDGVPKLACLAGKGGYPDMITDIVAVRGVLETLQDIRPHAPAPTHLHRPARLLMPIPARRQMGPSFESCSPTLDLNELTNFWTRSKDADDNWLGKDTEVPTGATSIAGQTSGESPYDACLRIGQASKALGYTTEPRGQARLSNSNPSCRAYMTSILPTRACRPQITDYNDFAATIKLDTPAVMDCPRTGGPTCPTGVTCPDGFETRGGTKEGLYTFLRNTFGLEDAEQMAKEYASPAATPAPCSCTAPPPVHPCALMRHALAPRPQ